jgi:CheY-like chemotaxis protein
MTQPLARITILVVEDEVIIGMMVCSEIERAGGIPIGPVTSVAGALKALGSQAVNAVILDAKLIDGSGAELAACLEKRKIPFVVISGYEAANLPRALRDAPFVAKPISVPVLVEAIGSLTTISERQQSPRPMATSLAMPDRTAD